MPALFRREAATYAWYPLFVPSSVLREMDFAPPHVHVEDNAQCGEVGQ
jgi:hypothetical protein